ncbi:dUTP diphosphatase [Candidatus Clostridium radicumherbarum]|uniref:dUTP diphosphatase n=1 Tax=Candidatus Clostridium radicumherbarum TaxID=3381662 RepID=A0ABW8TY31_9CLOT
MNLQKLYDYQNKLDEEIQSKIDTQGKLLLYQKLLALQVKVGELANETKCFHYWTSRKIQSRKRILEKYIEAIYLILSIGVEKGFTETDFEVKEVEYELTENFLNLFVDMNDFMVCSSKDHYITIIEDLLSLSLFLGFTEDDILNANSQVFSA